MGFHDVSKAMLTVTDSSLFENLTNNLSEIGTNSENLGVIKYLQRCGPHLRYLLYRDEDLRPHD